MMKEEFRLLSAEINNEGRLPRGEGEGARKNISPRLEWYNVPEGTKTLALVVQDIDAPDPSGPIVPWTPWVVVNIPPTLKRLPEGFSGKEEEVGGEYAGIKEGNNDWKVPGWRGPFLPNHGHRFEFKLYALDDEMHLSRKVTKEKLLDAIKGHVLVRKGSSEYLVDQSLVDSALECSLLHFKA
ncbi:hypothetical protein HHK36_016160 [Tetracentron sinense]|uniref:Uncharacterized protein n=1 Tax=Tetracentron sinense TaxID=13715 RepID=A0A834YZ78_TETSI|nr:hypothetical protein HHK36_016160 [Tetracentron sinense]